MQIFSCPKRSLFLGGKERTCWALIEAFLIQHSVSAKPQRTLHALHGLFVRSNSNNHLVFRCLFMSGTFICRQRSLCFLNGSFRDTSESRAAQVEDNYPSTPFLVGMWGHLTFDLYSCSTIPPLLQHLRSPVSENGEMGKRDCGRAPGTLFALPPRSLYNSRKKWPVVILKLGWREVTDRRHKPKPGHLFSVSNTSHSCSLGSAG